MGELLLIGEFARRCGLPVSTLRFYDRIGVLLPVATDPATGYRWYRSDQLPAALLANRLRSVGLPPAVIGRVLAGGPGAAAGVLRAERDRLRAELDARHLALADLDHLLAALTPAPATAAAVRLVQLTGEPVVALPVAAPAAELPGVVRRGVARLRTELRRHRLTWTGPWGGAFPSGAFPSGALPATAVPAAATTPVHGFVFVRLTGLPVPELDRAWLPDGPAAQVIHCGEASAVGATYQAALDFAAAAGRSVAGPVVEEYLDRDRIRLLVPLTA